MDPHDGEDAVCCRICRLPQAQDNPLFSPCKCSGSIKYVHQECLISWLNHSGHKHCELCRHRFRFRPIYAPNAPSRLPWTELVWGLAVKSVSGSALGARVLAVLLTWLFVVPLLTCWMWRLAFLTSFSQGLHEVSKRFQPVLVLADCIQVTHHTSQAVTARHDCTRLTKLQAIASMNSWGSMSLNCNIHEGSLISSALILVVLLATYTADEIRAYWQIVQPAAPAENRAAQPNRLPDFEIDEAVGAIMEQPAAEDASPSRAGSGDADDSQAEIQREAHGPPAQLARRRRLRVVRDGAEGEVHVPPGPDRAAGEAARPGAADEPVAQPDRDQFAFNELVGLEGPFLMLFQNAGTVLFTIWAFMTAALWMPFMLGRIAVSTVLTWKAALSGSEAWHPTEPLLGFLLGPQTAETARITQNSRVASAIAPANATSGLEPWEGLASKFALLPLAQRLAGSLEAHLGGPGLDDWFCLGVGYSILLMLAALAFWSLVVWKLLWGPHVRDGLRGHTDVLRAAFADFGHQTRLHLGYAAVMVKVCLICRLQQVGLVLTLELTLLPAIHGCWVDLCLLPLFGSSWADRMLWLQASPVSFLLVHWVMGLCFLMGVATFLSVLRQQLRPGVLPFFRDPYEGDEQPMRALMLLGLGQQLEREAYAMACLACLTVLLLHMPLRLTKAALPGMLPLRFSLGSPFAEAPTDLLLFHFLLPLTIPRLQVRYLLVRGIRSWLRGATRLLGLNEYLLPGSHGQPQQHQQPPAFIPQGFPGQDEDAIRTQQWQAEVEAAKQRAGRLVLLLTMLIGSLIALNTLLFDLPILTGRLIFWLAGLALQHDIYNGLCGAYAIWGLALLARHSARFAGCRSAGAAAAAALQWSQLALRVSMMALWGFGLLPLLVGLFLELSVLPIRLRPGETPACFIYQDWAVGLLFLRLFARCVLGWPRFEHGGHRRHDYDTSWLEARLRSPLRRLRANVRRLRREGIAHIGFVDAFRTILWPLTSFWGLAVCLPFIISRGIAPQLPFVDAFTLQTIFTYAWAAELIFFLSFICGVKIASALDRLGSKLRDQRYLLHRELINASD